MVKLSYLNILETLTLHHSLKEIPRYWNELQAITRSTENREKLPASRIVNICIYETVRASDPYLELG